MCGTQYTSKGSVCVCVCVCVYHTCISIQPINELFTFESAVMSSPPFPYYSPSLSFFIFPSLPCYPQLLNEACTSLTATGTAPHYTDTINKVYAVIASMQYLSQTAPAGKEFPSDKFGDKVDKITKALPDYTARVEAIGVQ